jgi:hypothetical protein
VAEYFTSHALRLALTFFQLQLDTPQPLSDPSKKAASAAAGAARGSADVTTAAAGAGAEAGGAPDAALRPALQGQPCLVGVLAAILPECIGDIAPRQLRARACLALIMSTLVDRTPGLASTRAWPSTFSSKRALATRCMFWGRALAKLRLPFVLCMQRMQRGLGSGDARARNVWHRGRCRPPESEAPSRMKHLVMTCSCSGFLATAPCALGDGKSCRPQELTTACPDTHACNCNVTRGPASGRSAAGKCMRSLLNSMQATALSLVELLANGGATTAVPLQTRSVAASLCALVTTHHVLPVDASDTPLTAPGATQATPFERTTSAQSADPGSARSARSGGYRDASAGPRGLTEPLAALRCLRLIATHQSAGGGAKDGGADGDAPVATVGFASHVFRAGLYPALSRHVIQAAALAVPLPGLPEHLTASDGAAAAAADDAQPPPCRNPRQVTARKSLLARLPQPHRDAQTPLGQLMGELAMWVGIGVDLRRSTGKGGWAVRGEVVAPLCSAVIDCFAYERQQFILEQPVANRAPEHECAPSDCVAA